VERKPRTVQIRELTLIELHGSRLVFRVRCSKGTYVRTLVEDMAVAAGAVAYTAALHREAVGDFQAQDMLDLGGAERMAEEGPGVLEARLLPPDQALSSWPVCRLPAAEALRFSAGQSVTTEHAGDGTVRVYGECDDFLGIGELVQNGRLAPRRIFRSGP
jgi:tRNA pseudouridine55 synthase